MLVHIFTKGVDSIPGAHGSCSCKIQDCHSGRHVIFWVESHAFLIYLLNRIWLLCKNAQPENSGSFCCFSRSIILMMLSPKKNVSERNQRHSITKVELPALKGMRWVHIVCFSFPITSSFSLIFKSMTFLSFLSFSLEISLLIAAIFLPFIPALGLPCCLIFIGPAPFVPIL